MIRFLRNQFGGTSVILALALPTVLLAAGGGVDLVRAAKARAELTRAVESAALAAASLSNARDAHAVVSEFIETNLSSNNDIKTAPTINVTSENALNARNLTVQATVEIETYFLGLIDIDVLEVSAAATAAESFQDVEISLVLDVSGSMSGAKIARLRDAAAEFIDEMFSAQRRDFTSMSLIPFSTSVNIEPIFDNFVVDLGDAVVDPPRNEYDIRYDVLTSPFRFTNGTNCLEYADPLLNNDDVFAENSLGQVPFFRDGIGCPAANNAAMFNTNNVGALRDRAEALTADGWTGMHYGAMWGYRALSPKWRGELGGTFGDRPKDWDDVSVKTMILMSDGNITQQVRPRDPVDDPDGRTRTVLVSGDEKSAKTDISAAGQFKRVCDAAKDDNIIIFTIGFQIELGSVADSLLKECATSEAHYIFVDSLDIASAFRAIASSLNALRITG